MPDISAAITRAISESATSFGANEAFGLSRAVARPYYKFTLILEANATGQWVPQQTATVPIIVFEHGVNDNFSGIPNPFINAGISGTPATRSIEITNSPRNGGFSMIYQAIILAVGVVLERLRVITPDGSNNVARDGDTPAHVQRSGGSVGDNEWQLIDRLIVNLLGASEWQLIPVNTNTDCNLMVGVPQLMTARTGWENGPTSTGKNEPKAMWVFRDDIVVNPGISGNNDQPNRLQLSWLDGVLASIEPIKGTTPRDEHTLLALDMVCVVDVAFGRLSEGKRFTFATPFDALKYDCYREAV